MSYYLTKLVTQLIYPLHLGLLGMAIGYLLMMRERTRSASEAQRAGHRLLRRLASGPMWLGASMVWLWLWSTPAFSARLNGSLERMHPPVAVEALPSAEAIVVLGGCIGPPVPPRLYAELNDASSRLWHAARLYRAGKAPIVIVTSPTNETAAMKEFLAELGVPEAAILREMKSRTTYENALHTRELLASLKPAAQRSTTNPTQRTTPAPRILLVTSAMHMPRAEMIFRRAHFDVVAAATDYKVIRDPRPGLQFAWLPDAGALGGSTAAFKEYVGYWIYRLYRCP